MGWYSDSLVMIVLVSGWFVFVGMFLDCWIRF